MPGGPARVRRSADSRCCKFWFSPVAAAGRARRGGVACGRAAAVILDWVALYGAVWVTPGRAGRSAAMRLGSGLLVAVLLAGCAASNGFSLFGGITQPENEPASADAEVCPTPEACTAELKKMVGEPRRDWIGRPQSAEAYANGTRLFAYRALRKKLTCGELKTALDDTSSAAALLQAPHHERARALATAVGHELKSEHDRRCHPKH